LDFFDFGHRTSDFFFSINNFFNFDTFLSPQSDHKMKTIQILQPSERQQSAVHQLNSSDDDILSFGNSVMVSLTYPNDFTLVFELHETSLAHSEAKKTK
jgi:hypothetical protein